MGVEFEADQRGEGQGDESLAGWPVSLHPVPADDDRDAENGRGQHFFEEAETPIPDDADGRLHGSEDQRQADDTREDILGVIDVSGERAAADDRFETAA